MYANKDIYKKSTGKTLRVTEGLAAKEVVCEFNREKIGASFCSGSKPIDGTWPTPGFTVVGACVMPT